MSRPPLVASPDEIREALARNAAERKFLRRLLKVVDGCEPALIVPESEPERVAGPAPLAIKTAPASLTKERT